MCPPLPQDQDDTCRTLPGAPARLSSGLGALQVGLWGPKAGRQLSHPVCRPPVPLTLFGLLWVCTEERAFLSRVPVSHHSAEAGVQGLAVQGSIAGPGCPRDTSDLVEAAAAQAAQGLGMVAQSQPQVGLRLGLMAGPRRLGRLGLGRGLRVGPLSRPVQARTSCRVTLLRERDCRFH